MKILVLTPTFFPLAGGAERGIYEISRRLARDHQVVILTPEPKPKYQRFYGAQERGNLADTSSLAEMANSPSFLLVQRFKDRQNMMNWPGQGKLAGIIPPFSLSAVRATCHVISRFKPHVLCVFYGLPTGLAGVLAKKRQGIPFVLALIGRDLPAPGIPPFWKKYLWWVARRSDHLIFISQFGQKALLGEERKRGKIIPFGVDLHRFSPEGEGLAKKSIRKRLNLPDSAPLLFSLQRLDPWKKTDILIQAVELIRRQGWPVYLIIGGKGPERPKLEKKIKELKLEKSVFLSDYIPEAELPAYYQAADIFCFHSTYETFGLVLLEAMASGKPIVATRSTAIPELIEDGLNGLLVEPERPTELAAAIVLLLQNSSLREKLSQEAKKKACGFSWEKISAQYEAVVLQAQCRPEEDSRVQP